MPTGKYKRSESHLKNMSISHAGIPSPLKGKTYTDIYGEDKAKKVKSNISTALINRPSSIRSRLRSMIGLYPDFPKKGILFKDLSPLYGDKEVLQNLVSLARPHCYSKDMTVVAIGSRGYILGAMLAHAMKVPLVLLCKPGKLPGSLIFRSYDLEYGSDSLEMQINSVKTKNVIICDDVVATGGTARCAYNLVKTCHSVENVRILTVLDLKFSNDFPCDVISLL